MANLIDKVKSANSMEIIDYIHKGVPVNAINDLPSTLSMSKKEIFDALGLSTRTISRREVLTIDEADKLIRLVRIYILALDVFEDRKIALQWLIAPQIAFAKKTPMSLLDTDFGAREVERLLKQIEYGVYV